MVSLLNLCVHPETNFLCQERRGFFGLFRSLGKYLNCLLESSKVSQVQLTKHCRCGRQQQHRFSQGATGLEKVQGADGTGVSRQTEVTGAKQGRESPESSVSQCGSVKEGPVHYGSERNCQD